LTSLGMRNQLGARALESAWIEPATWVWVISRNCARQGQTPADLPARGHARRPLLGRCLDLDCVALGHAYVARSGSDPPIDLDHQASACEPQAMIIKPDAPKGKELSEGDVAGSSAFQPYLAGRVMRMHRGLQRASPINSDVRRHLHRSAIDGYAEIDDPRIPAVADRLGLQTGSLDVGHGITRRIPRRWRTALHRWGGRSLLDAASEREQHHQHGRERGARAPPAARHEVENRTRATFRRKSWRLRQQPRWYIAFRPFTGSAPCPIDRPP
jgi:hypothetical protein